MSNTWIQALKQWNTINSPQTWCIPRSGTVDHETVRALQKQIESDKNKRDTPELDVDVAIHKPKKSIRFIPDSDDDDFSGSSDSDDSMLQCAFFF